MEEALAVDEAEDEGDELGEQAIDNAENGADEVGEDGTNGAEDGSKDREVATNNLEDLSEDGHNKLMEGIIRKSDEKRITKTIHTVRTPARSCATSPRVTVTVPSTDLRMTSTGCPTRSLTEDRASSTRLTTSVKMGLITSVVALSAVRKPD